MSSQLVSIVPDALTALHQIATDSLNDVLVLFGHEPTDDSNPRRLWVGWDVFRADGDVADFGRDWAEGGANYGALQESEGEIFCSLWVENGDSDPAAAINEAKELFTTFGDAIRTRPTLGVPRIISARLNREQWRWEQEADVGAWVHISFTVHITAQH